MINLCGQNNLNAIILAAGKGERLLPLTQNTPKCLVELFGKKLLKSQIETFHQCGIYDISVVTGYCNEKISYSDVNYFYNKSYGSTNMIETLFCAEEKLLNSTIISYGDIIFEKQVLEKLIISDDDISVVIDKSWERYWKIRFDNPLDDAETLVLDDQNYILDIGQKTNNLEQIQSQYIGLMKFQNHASDFIKDFYDKMKNNAKLGRNPLNAKIPFEKSYMTDFLQGLINEKCRIKAIPINNGWLELDSINDYKIYQKKIQDGSIKKFINFS